ncbi:MAG: GreA/GreB family elongation factor, partial [Chloroflexota bacterium]
SPVGRALLGKRVGDAVEVTAPAGKRRLKIIEVA